MGRLGSIESRSATSSDVMLATLLRRVSSVGIDARSATLILS
jgi:hypothetical protein